MRAIKFAGGVVAVAVAVLVGAAPVYGQASFRASNPTAISGTTGSGACTLMDVSGMGTATWDVTGTWVGTITFYVSGGAGTRNQIDIAKADTPATAVNTTTANGVWSGSVAGYASAIACFTSYTSGSAIVTISAAGTGGGSGGGGAGGGGGEVTSGDAGSFLATVTLSATDNAVLDDIADGIVVTATNLDVQIGGSDTVAVSNAGLTELAAAINSNLVDVNIVSGAGSGGTAVADDADFTAGTTSFTPVGGFYQSSPTACTDGDTCAVGITSSREMKVFAVDLDVQSGGADLATQTSMSAAATSLAIIDNVVFGAGTEAAALRVTLATDSTGVVSVDDNGSSLTVDGTVTVTDGAGALNVICDSGCSGGTTDTDDASIATGQSIGLSGSLGMVYDGSVWRRTTIGTAGTAATQVTTIQGIASMTPILATVTATNLDVQIGGSDSLVIGTNAALVAGTANIGDVDLRVAVGGTSTAATGATEGSISALHVIIVDPVTDAAAVLAGACTPISYILGASVNETEVKDTGGYLDWAFVSNLDATPVYLKFYDLDNDDLDENDTPIARLMIPANATAALGAAFTSGVPGGMAFSNAISFRATTAMADNSTAALTANEVLVNVCYR